jgi:hypothetical protein
MTEPITMRRSTAADLAAMERLAQLDSARAPSGEAYLAFVGPELRALVSVDDGRALGDPFRPTADLVELLHLRAARERRAARRSERRPRWVLPRLRPRRA